jgi:hypothetical protein
MKRLAQYRLNGEKPVPSAELDPGFSPEKGGRGSAEPSEWF